MGLAASQCRLLTLTSRASDLELECMMLSARTLRNAQKSYELMCNHNDALDELDAQSKDPNSDMYTGYQWRPTSYSTSGGSGSPEAAQQPSFEYTPEVYDDKKFDLDFVAQSGCSIEHKNYMNEDGSAVRTEDAVNADIKKLDDADAVSKTEIEKLDTEDAETKAAILQSVEDQQGYEQDSQNWEDEKKAYAEGIEEGKKDIAKFEGETIPAAQTDLDTKTSELEGFKNEATTLTNELNGLNQEVNTYDTVTIPNLAANYSAKLTAQYQANNNFEAAKAEYARLATSKASTAELRAQSNAISQAARILYNVAIPQANTARINLDNAKSERANKKSQAQSKQTDLNNKNNQITQKNTEVNAANSKLEGYKKALETLKDKTGEKEAYYNEYYSENPHTEKIQAEIEKQAELQGKIDANVTKKAELQGKIDANVEPRTKLQAELTKIQNKAKNGYSKDEQKLMNSVKNDASAFLNALQNGDIVLVDANGNKVDYASKKAELDEFNAEQRAEVEARNAQNQAAAQAAQNPSSGSPSGGSPNMSYSYSKDKDNYQQAKDKLERDYELAEKELSMDDKKIQMQQQQVNTELNAVNQEIESVKSLIDKNTERGFSYFNA